MNTKDVLKIIRAARKVGLESIELEGLKMRFFAGDAEVRTVNRIERLRPEQQTELELVRREDDLSAVEDDLDSLQIDDPALYEKMIVERDIELGDNRPDEAANEW